MIGITSQKKRLLRLLFSFVMIMTILSSIPLTAFAAASDNLCDHHTEHTAECGYVAEQGEASCTYECAECFSNVEDGSPVPEGDGTDAAVTYDTCNQYTITFASDDGSDVTSITQDYGTAPISDVEKTDPAYTVPTGLTASYGQTLADVALPKADNGTWSWVKAGTTKVGLPGNKTFKAVFTPNDTVNYNTVTVDVTITVSQTVLTDVRKPVVIAPEALAAPQTTLDKGPHYAAVLFWNTDKEVFGFNTAYTASISLTPSPHQGYVFDKDVIESIRSAMEAEGWKVYGNEKSLSMSKTFEPTRKADLTITLADQTITYGEVIDGSCYSFVCELPDVQVTAGLVPSTQQSTANGQITLGEVVVTDAGGMDITDTLNIQSNTARLTVNRRPVVFTAQAQTIVYGQTISGSAYTADGLLDGHSAVVNLIPGTGNITANGTIAPSGAVLTADSTDVTDNYEISYVTGKLVIKPDTSKIDSLTTENVTSANKNDIQAVLDMMADAETEGGDEETLAAWAAITAKCEELLDNIDAAASAPQIENTEKVEELIDKVTENITRNEEAATKAADDSKTALTELDKSADPNSPQTGDNTQMWLWWLLLIVSAMGIAAICIEQKKQKAMK